MKHSLGLVLCAGALTMFADAQQANQASRKNQRTLTKAERAVSGPLTARFLRTRELLTYLERNDRPTYASLLQHSRALARRAAAAALDFAREHHRELADLLLELEQRNRAGFDSAIRELVTDSQRLERTKKRDPGAYAAALEAWKLRSQIRLLAARMALAKKPQSVRRLTKLRGQLEALLTREEAAKREQTKAQIERLEKTIEQLRKRLAQDPAENVRRRLRSLDRRIKRRKRK